MSDLLKQLLARAITPLVPQIGQAADSAATGITNPVADESPTMAKLKGFGAGALQGLGHMASDMTSPANIALSIPSMGSEGLIGSLASRLLSKGGAEAAPIVAKAPSLFQKLSESAPAVRETLGEINPMFTPRGGEEMLNVARQNNRIAMSPMEASYQEILRKGGR